MTERWTKVRRQVTTYGMALGALAGAEAAEGAVVSLTPNPSTMPYVGAGSVSLGVSSLTFFQYNDDTGKSLDDSASITGFRTTSYGNTITPNLSFIAFLSLGVSSSGTRTFAFRTAANQVGWIRMNLGGSGGAITYLSAAFQDTPGAGLIAGTLTPAEVPEPATVTLFGLGLLAMGAAGVRKLRRRQTVEA